MQLFHFSKSSILTANSAELTPLSILTLATGIILGIWMVESSASRPPSLLIIGTLITTFEVLEAITLGWAACEESAEHWLGFR